MRTLIEQVNTIQAYLRENARRQYEMVPLAPFSLFFHPSDPFIYFNYAIPDFPTTGDPSLKIVLNHLSVEFRRRGRIPRFEFLLDYAPILPSILLDAGFHETDRQWNMICSPADLQPPVQVPEIEVVRLHPESATADVRDYIIAQRQGFNPSDNFSPDEGAIRQARLDFLVGGWQAYLARISGEPAAAAAFGRIIAGVSELAGIATRVPFRQRGIATYLTWLATSDAFNDGAQTTCLTAADSNAGRIYEHIGYKPFATMLSFSLPEAYDRPITP
ncbi:MAG: GNAT family N-acetyltransferase [Anaerolineaceae bacterium]|nr:GNAT family N-acetyltransferase [Anaerolineaceae bacterium]